MQRRLVLLLLAVLAAGATAAPPARAARGMELGYFDVQFTFHRDWLLREAAADGAQAARVIVPWDVVAPTRPADPADPTDPAYDWRLTDRAAATAAAHGIAVTLNLLGAPPWAEGPGRPPEAPPRSWLPDPAALGAFAEAAARRYSGTTPGVPRVARWQVWNEPNLETYLSPQWRGRANVAAPHYRAMLNAVYAAVKRVDPAAVVLTGGTAPYGDGPGGLRTRPVEFWRRVLRRRTSFDGWAHHPYGVSGPRRSAVHRHDAAVPDLGRIDRVIRRAVRAGRAVPRRAKRPWVTEVGWDSSPPDPDGVAEARHARWMAGALFAFWRARAVQVLWLRVRDAPPEPSYAASIQSGTRLADGTPKLGRQTFLFPFAAAHPRRGRRTVRVWGMAPQAGRVAVQRQDADRWRTIARPRAGTNRVFVARVRARRGATLRAVAAGATSLTWRVGRDG